MLVTNRTSTSEHLLKVEQECPAAANVRCPRFVIVREKINSESFSELLHLHQMSFPFMVKPIQACGSAESHYLGVVFRVDDLDQFQPPFLVQEFFNHNGVIFKVFVLGDTVEVVSRRSFKNFSPEKDHKSFIFDSQKMKDLLSDGDLDTLQSKPPVESLRLMAATISRRLRMHLFGFDVVTNVADGRHAIVDLNFFPGYVGVDNVHNLLLDLCSQLHSEHLLQS